MESDAPPIERTRAGPARRRRLVAATPWLAGLAVFAAVCLGPDAGRVLSFDTFLHVYLGEHMLRTGELVDADPSNWAVTRPYLDHEWVPQLLLGALHLGLGLEGLVLFTALLAGAAFAMTAAWMQRRGAGPVVTVVLVLAAFSAVRFLTLARPFLLSWVLAVAWTMLLERLFRGELAPRRWLAAAVPLMWLWANLHAGFLLGFVLLGIFGLAQLWRVATAAGPGRRRAFVLFLWMVGGGQLAFFASALNLYGFRLHAHFLVYLANSRLVGQIIEWQAPYFHQPEFLAALLLLGLFLAAGLAGRRPDAAELLLVVALTLAALRAQRNLPIFVLLVLPFAGSRLEELLAELADSSSVLARPARWLRALSLPPADAGPRRGGLLAATALGAAAVAAAGLFAGRPIELDPKKFPVAAARFVDERPRLFAGRMFNLYSWGGYLAWRLAPAHRVYVNGLQDHHGPAHHAAYRRVFETRPGWQRTLDDAGVDWVIVPARTPLATVLDLDPSWREVYLDSLATIFVRAEEPRGAEPAAGAARTDGAVNVLLLVLDTTRADAVGAYGEGPAATPTLDRLAGEGTLFRRARSTSAWTLPSHGSLFTGLFPSRHGAHWEHRLLAPERVALAEVLAPTHQTAGFCENPHITHAQGFAQGFEEFAETWRPRPGGNPDTLDRVRPWLERRDPARPFFLFVNLMTPHLPYRPPDDLLEAFLPAGATPGEIAEMRAFDERQARRFVTGDLELDARRLAVLRALYRADVAAADRRLARLLEPLEDAGELDRTLVVVLSDHGENLGEHGLMEHQLCLCETLLRVPMILRLPGVVAAGKVDDAPVQLVDVVPTVLDAAGVPRDRWPVTEGVSLLRGSPPPEREVFAEYMRPGEQKRLFAEAAPGFDFTPYDRRLKSIQVGDLKLIVAEGGPAELYDLAADPGETRDLAAERPQLVEALGRRLESWSGGWDPGAGGGRQPVLDEDTAKALRSLGYVD